jgi:hypothetical protein
VAYPVKGIDMTKSTCQQCGVEYDKTHGRMKYCPEHRGRAADQARELITRTCVHCAATFTTRRSAAKLCGDACKSAHYKDAGVGFEQTVTRLPAEHPVRQLIRARATSVSAHRECWERGDYPGFLAALGARSTTTAGGCWVWPRLNRDDYPVVKWRRQTKALHRLALEAKHGGESLGKQAAHHMCANSACVNPDHLQPVTARENTAEMLARTYMETRIADLEAALGLHDPHHPLLGEIGVVEVA